MPYASLAVSCGELDRAGASLDRTGASTGGGGTATLASGFSVREALGLGEGFGVLLLAGFEAEGVGVGRWDWFAPVCRGGLDRIRGQGRSGGDSHGKPERRSSDDR